MIETPTISNVIKDQENELQDELIEFLSIPSISSDSAHKEDVRNAAKFVQDQLVKAGVDSAELMETAGLPVVYAERYIDSVLPTLLVYGHFDVQPADPIELWHSDPFEPVIKEGKIYARGACDDKAQMMIPIKAFELLNQRKDLGYNLKFLFEGEEEIGSVSLSQFIKENSVLLHSDVAIIVDTFQFDSETPAIVYGVKGAIMLNLEIQGPEQDMHSGLYGGIVKNPADELARIIASFKDDNGKILIEGFYKNLTSPSSSDLRHLEKWAEKSGGLEELKIQAYVPTLEVNGMRSGYGGAGGKTIIPAKASAKISMRIVPGQTSKEVFELFKAHVTKVLRSDHFELTIEQLAGFEAAVMETEHWIFEKAKQACTRTYEADIVFQRMGGSIPVVGFFKELLGIQSLLIGFGLESDNIHAPNEHYHLSNYYRGIETLTHLLKSTL
jgi:acetylornithine deacetylase/succinyl-diaminopimelate desuccinylase-like protein